MRAYEFILKELLEPKKPGSAVKSSTVSVSGAQGSISKISQQKFTTSKGNVVKVWFKPTQADDGNPSVEITFYVNDTVYDNSSSEGKDIANDFEILSGVGYLVNNTLDRKKLNHCTFLAYSSNRDTRTKFNIPLEKYLVKLNHSLTTFYDQIANFNPTPEQLSAELERRNALLARLKRPLETSVNMVDPNLTNALSQMHAFINQPFDETSLERYSKLLTAIEHSSSHYVYNNTGFPKLINDLHEFKLIVRSYSKDGAEITSNRRASVYSKLIQKFFSDKWDIKTQGAHFTLTRKLS
jgi:hypothetical protein